MAHLGQPPDRHRRPWHLRPSAVPARRLAAAQGAARRLSVRPMLVTLLGYLVIIDAAINTVGWALDLVANHTMLARVLLNGWGDMFDAGYFWHYNELWLGGAAGPGRKGHGSRADPHRLHHADRRGDRVPADEAVGPPVDDHHLLDGRADLVRLRVQHDDVSPTCGSPAWSSRSSAGGSTTSSTSPRSSRSRTCTRSTARSSPTDLGSRACMVTCH